MFRVLDVSAEGRATVHEGDVAIQAALAPPDPGIVRWIDLEAQDADSLELLRSRFDFHPLAIEDCLHLDQRPKVEEFGAVVFVVTHGFLCPEAEVKKLEPLELHSFLGPGYLVTVHQEPLPQLDAAWKRALAKPILGTRGADFLHYLVVDHLVDSNFPILDKFSEELETLEEAVLWTPSRAHLARIFALKHELAIMRRVLSPQRDVVLMLAKLDDEHVSPRNAAYYRDVYDHLVRISESIDSNRDLLGSTMDAYLSSVSNRTNEIMKYLTLMSALFLPLSFVVGFFGQNFDDMPGMPGWTHSHQLMWVMLVACLGIPTAMIGWFRYKKWL